MKNEMKMPGFTAEASVCGTDKPYFRSTIVNYSICTPVIPQLPPTGAPLQCGSCVSDANSSTGFSHKCCRAFAGCIVTSCTPSPPPTTPGGGSTSPSPSSPSGGLAIYGNYCGPGHGDPKYQTPPIDAVDAACMAHDMCYDKLGYLNCACDRALLDSLRSVSQDPMLSTAGQVAGFAVYNYFSVTPCLCYPKVCIPFFGCFSSPIPLNSGVGGIGFC